MIARWSASTGWVDRDGLPLPDTVLVIGLTTVLRRWQDKRPEYITECPLPDVEQLNAAIPVSDWECGLDGKPRKPWARTYVVYMVDLQTGALYTYAHDTYGAMLAYNALEEQIAVTRMLRGQSVWPIARLEKRQWKSTTFGMQMRPHFQVVDWRTMGGPSSLPQQPPSPQLPGPKTATAVPESSPTAAPPAAEAGTAPAAAPVTAPAAPPTAPPASGVLAHTQPMQPITTAELIADELPWK